MKFDLRLPIGILFSLYGLLLTLYGVLANKEQYARSLGMNVNVSWGVVMLIFGVLMLFFARRGAKKSE